MLLQCLNIFVRLSENKAQRDSRHERQACPVFLKQEFNTDEV